MAVRKITVKEWNRLVEANDPSIADLSGPSPGGAAAELGISRQAVHKAIRRGALDALAVYEGKKLSHYTISVASIARYREHIKATALQRIVSLETRRAAFGR